ncbi:flagellin [Aquibacillus salsiterrae]|uniref:flagellin n=1 Tax=Aquibacillus salsiterrae TaxID=2950439 RepID=UPI00234257B0|nr:flagellin [Aquibacillus salsiterrae]
MISLIQTAEGALNESHSILQRMRELAVQSSNDTNTADDREEIQKEINQLTDEIDRIGDTTEFNTKNLLNGGAGLEVNFSAETVSGNNADWIKVVGGTSETTADGANIAITDATAATAATDSTVTASVTDGSTQSFTLNGKTITYTSGTSATTTGDAIAAAVNQYSDELGITASNSSGTLTFTTSDTGSDANIDLDAAAGALEATAVAIDVNGSDADINSTQIADTDYVASGDTIKVVSGTYKGLELKLNADTMSTIAADNDATFSIDSNGSLSYQIGANEGQDMDITINDMRAAALGVNNIDVTTTESAKSAITTINDAIQQVSGERSKLGAYQNRLEHTINNLGTSAENLTAAESRIRDVDMAKEMMNQTKNSILGQAAQAMLAQSQQLPQGVLQLLR